MLRPVGGPERPSGKSPGSCSSPRRLRSSVSIRPKVSNASPTTPMSASIRSSFWRKIGRTRSVCSRSRWRLSTIHCKHATLPAAPRVKRGQRVEHEYERGGAPCYLAAWDARCARLFDRCAPKDGIEPFDQLVEQFMTVEPYSKAQRVFVILDNGSAHRGQRSIDRLQGTYKNLILVHTPVHASWLNQAEIYFSVVQRKVLTPNDFPDLDTLEQHLLAFGRRYEQIAQPFEWKFTRADLDHLTNRLELPAAQAA